MSYILSIHESYIEHFVFRVIIVRYLETFKLKLKKNSEVPELLQPTNDGTSLNYLIFSNLLTTGHELT
jgi:hypothetical protein